MFPKLPPPKVTLGPTPNGTLELQCTVDAQTIEEDVTYTFGWAADGDAVQGETPDPADNRTAPGSLLPVVTVTGKAQVGQEWYNMVVLVLTRK